jgi:Uma2 family endonuclease
VKRQMSSVAVEQRWTYRDLAALPDDCLRHELIDGEHVVTPSPATNHQLIASRLLVNLSNYVERTGMGQVLSAPFDVKLSLITVLVPDLVYFTAERFARVVNKKHATAAPDLVIEILSPGTRRRDLGAKRAVYDREGVVEYWMVDPDARRVTVLRRPMPTSGLTSTTTLAATAGATITSPLFPGLALPLSDLFRGLR